MHQERTINKHSCQNSLHNFLSKYNYPVSKGDHCGFSFDYQTTEAEKQNVLVNPVLGKGEV